MNWFKSRKVVKEEKKELPQWEEDYILSEMPDLGLFDEYLEMGMCFKHRKMIELSISNHCSIAGVIKPMIFSMWRQRVSSLII